jgi:ribosome-associated protein
VGKIEAASGISIDESELEERFVQAAGPGGQNVNKVATAVQLRFNVASSPSLPEPVRQRLIRLGGRRVSLDGVLIITARRFRTQERNREDARKRLLALIKDASKEVPRRKPTQLPHAAKQRRLERKKIHSALKRQRASPPAD